jgi:hypothetical protein
MCLDSRGLRYLYWDSRAQGYRRRASEAMAIYAARFGLLNVASSYFVSEAAFAASATPSLLVVSMRE